VRHANAMMPIANAGNWRHVQPSASRIGCTACTKRN